MPQVGYDTVYNRASLADGMRSDEYGRFTYVNYRVQSPLVFDSFAVQYSN